MAPCGPPVACLARKSSLLVWSELLRETSLSPHAIEIATERVARTGMRLRSRVWRLGWYYRCAKTFVTLGALLVPALTGLDSQRLSSDAIFWLIWSVSLATSASNAFVSLFGIDRAYFSCSQQLAALETEAWSFAAASGHYHDKSHQESFAVFMEHCEAILNKAARRQLPEKQAKRAAAGQPPGAEDGKSEATSKDEPPLLAARSTGSRLEAV